MKSGKLITITPALAGFGAAYTTADVLGGVNTIPKAVLSDGGSAKLTSLSILDKANQKSAIDLIFFSEAPVTTVGSDNAAYVLDDTDLAKVIGRVTVAAASYVSSSTTNAEATVTNLQLILQAKAKSQDLYVLAVARGGPTYGAATDLVIRLGLEQF